MGTISQSNNHRNDINRKKRSVTLFTETHNACIATAKADVSKSFVQFQGYKRNTWEWMLLQEISLSSGAWLRLLTHLPISKVIFTSSAGCIMHDRVNQPETKGRWGWFWKNSLPSVDHLPFFHQHTLRCSHHLLSCMCTLSSPSLNLPLTPLPHSTNYPHLQKWGAGLKENPQEPSILILLQPHIICIVAVNYSPIHLPVELWHLCQCVYV